MPPKETSSNIYICTDEEHYVPLSKISDVFITEGDIADFEHEKFNFDGVVTFEIEPSKNHHELGPFIELFHPSISWLSWWLKRYGSNNWRKLHGFPMRRKKHGNSKRCS